MYTKHVQSDFCLPFKTKTFSFIFIFSRRYLTRVGAILICSRIIVIITTLTRPPQHHQIQLQQQQQQLRRHTAGFCCMSSQYRNFERTVLYIYKWYTYSTVWLSHGWCHVNCCHLGAFSVHHTTTTMPRHFVQNHILRLHACLTVTCHLHF